jgi:hypothetical protein
MEGRLVGWNNQCVAEFLSLEDQENGRRRKKNTNCKNSQGARRVKVKAIKMNRRNVEVDRHCFEKDEGTSWRLENDDGRSSSGLRMRS